MSWKIFSLPHHAGLPHTTAKTDGELLLTAEQRTASCVLYHTNDASLFTGGYRAFAKTRLIAPAESFGGTRGCLNIMCKPVNPLFGHFPSCAFSKR